MEHIVYHSHSLSDKDVFSPSFYILFHLLIRHAFEAQDFSVHQRSPSVPVIIHFRGIFHDKPASLGIPHLGNPPKNRNLKRFTESEAGPKASASQWAPEWKPWVFMNRKPPNCPSSSPSETLVLFPQIGADTIPKLSISPAYIPSTRTDARHPPRFDCQRQHKQLAFKPWLSPHFQQEKKNKDSGPSGLSHSPTCKHT